MIQLTSEERQILKERAQRHPTIVSRMQEEVAPVLNEPVLAPETGIANWGLYFYCPACSVRLIYNRYDAKHHRCPQCGAVHTGEPYDSSWWRYAHGQNEEGAMTLGWLYILTGEMRYARKAAEILTTYARLYPNYQEHGDIPYNGPGRACAQTLDEAVFLRSLAIAYDLVSEVLSSQEHALIREQLLLPGALFLMEHRYNHIHNHEVIVDSAIAAIGLLLERSDMIDFALYQPYGLIYQLEHGVQDNGMWFEGSFGYHFYALQSFLAYEKFALHTAHSHIRHPNYARMVDIVYDYLQPDGELPRMNDTTLNHFDSCMPLYEFLYRELGDDAMLAMLHNLYKKHPRNSQDALLYGVEELPPCPQLQQANPYHPSVGGKGHTILHGKDERYLLLKNDRYGGEHDHYDRLGLSYFALGQEVAPDLGTTGYGAVLHYDYYKNTGSHNTVVISGANQAPADAVLTRFEQLDGMTYVEAVCNWNQPYQMPDSFTIVQWDADAYRHVKMTRRIAWTDDFFAEVFLVEGVDAERTIDWVMHFCGRHVVAADVNGLKVTPEPGSVLSVLSEEKPYRHIRDVSVLKGGQPLVHTFAVENVKTNVHSMAFAGETMLATGFSNPSYETMPYLIERTHGGHAVFAHVIESYTEAPLITRVDFAPGEEGVQMNIQRNGLPPMHIVL